jgi:DNA (cytosine-5)-methyltransferase 1
MGYHRAGFEDITGVDIEPMPRYPFKFVQGDALEYLKEHGHEFDVIHASPPCQVHSVLSHLAGAEHNDYIPETRRLLKESSTIYVIENVPGSPLINPFMLCGTMFGLKTKGGAQLRRHRYFEASFDVLLVPPCSHNGRTIGLFGNKARDTAAEKRHYSQPKDLRGGPPTDVLFSLEDARQVMGMDWASMKDLSQAIPPAYTEFIGRRILGCRV